MIFPDTLVVQAIDVDTGSPVANVALVLMLRAPKKNDYRVGPVITDDAGHAKFTRAQCERTIARAQEMFVMDYFGDLSSCAPTAQVRVHFPEHVTRMIEQYDKSPQFWGRAFDDAPALFRGLRTVRNADFESAQVTFRDSEIAARPEISIMLKRTKSDAADGNRG